MAFSPSADERTGDESIYQYIIRYGGPGYLGRFGSIREIPCSRGDRVVVETGRGTELGEVLLNARDAAATADEHRPAGELLRRATPEDERRADDLGSPHAELLRRSEELVRSRGIDVAVLDGETLLDGRTVILYYLGEPTSKLGPLAVELSDRYRVQFQPLESPDAPPEPAPAPARDKQEQAKHRGHFLYGTIAAQLEDDDADHFTGDDVRLLQFHGVYQQDDRDVRQRNKASGDARREHFFMVRTKAPGGKLTAEQLLAQLDLCDRFGNGTLRITSRQGFQLHGLLKRDLPEAVRRTSEALLTTYGACGDVQRNVMCCPAPLGDDPARAKLQATANTVARHFQPQSTAYFDIWIDGRKEPPPHLSEDAEPIYGRTYLPHKFKTAIALPEDNCVDVYTQDVGLLAVLDDGRSVEGFNVLVGGGLGTTPSDQNTFPRLAVPLAFVPAADLLRVLTAIVEVQRDFGNREERRRARLKYLLHDWGIEAFKQRVEEYLGGHRLAPPRPLEASGVEDHLGWHSQGDGRCFLGLHVESGRIRDQGGLRLKTALRRIADRFAPTFRLTPQQNLLVCGLESGVQGEIHSLLADHGVPLAEDVGETRRHALACPALPTCGLAIAEAERALPAVLRQLEAELASLGLAGEAIDVRMTGCPNGCARPYTAEIGLVGRAAGKYTILIGGGKLGARLNFVYKEMVPQDEIAAELRPLLASFAAHRLPGEALGDFCHRRGPGDVVSVAADSAGNKPR